MMMVMVMVMMVMTTIKITKMMTTTMMLVLVLVLTEFHIGFYDVVGFRVLIASACIKGLPVGAYIGGCFFNRN